VSTGAVKGADGFWFLICYAATQLAIQVQQERIQFFRSNRVARKRPAESNGTPAIDFGLEDLRKRRYTNKKEINKTHIHKHAKYRNSIEVRKESAIEAIFFCCSKSPHS